MLEFLKYGGFPMIMAPEGDEGGAGGGAGGDAGAGDAGAGDNGQAAGDEGGAGGDAGAQGGDNGGEGDEGGQAAGDEGAGSKATGGTQKPAAKVGDATGEGDEGGDEGQGDADWRKALAGEDEADLKTLNRFNSQKDLWKAYKELRSKVSSQGSKLPENATDEEKAEWREKNGIPKDADGYLDSLPEGLVLGEDVKEQAEDYLKEMHEMDASPEVVAKGLEMFQKHQEAYAEQVSKMDQQKAADATAQLKEEWGSDYDGNIQALHNFLEGNFPKDVQESLMNGRLGDDEGTPLLCHPGVIEAFSRIQRELNPMGSTSSGQGMDNLDAIEEQIKTYEDRMGNDRSNWYKDEKAQAHYRELLNARERYQTRSKSAA